MFDPETELSAVYCPSGIREQMQGTDRDDWVDDDFSLTLYIVCLGTAECAHFPVASKGLNLSSNQLHVHSYFVKPKTWGITLLVLYGWKPKLRCTLSKIAEKTAAYLSIYL